MNNEENMFVQQTLEKYMTYHTLPSEDGQNQGKSDLKEQVTEEKDSIVLEILKNTIMEENPKKRKRAKSVTQELVVNTKKKTSEDKLNNSNQTIPSMKSSKTLD